MSDFGDRPTWYYKKVLKNPFHRQLLINIGIIAIAVILGVVGLSFVLGDVSTKADMIAQYRVTSAMRNNNLNNIVDLQKAAASAATYQVAINRLMPTEDNLISFPQQIQTTAESHNITAQASFSGDPVPAANGAPGFVAFSLSASGDASNTIAFLKDLETQSSQFLIAIDSADFTTDGSSGNLSANGRVFFQ